MIPSDPFDAASELEQASRDEAVARVRLLNEPETHPDFDGETCISCGSDIPPARLAMGKIRCVACQSVIEQVLEQYGRL